MRIRRIGVLLKKEFVYGSKSYFFIFAVVAPLSATLIFNLIFISTFSGKPKMGIFDRGHSQIMESLKQLPSINLKEYPSEIVLQETVKDGRRDVGIVLPKDLDSIIKKGESIEITTYIWGESLLKNRAIISAAFLYQLKKYSGEKTPVDIIPVSLGDKNNVPLKDRFLPVIVLMAIFISGFAIPSTSLAEEKQKRTIGALLTTPVTQNELFVSKGLVGIIVSIVMGISILILNQAFNAHWFLVIFIMLLGAIMATCFGLMLGAFAKDISSVYSVIQGLNIFIYAPGILIFFPQMPQWIGKFFPTYYVMNPIIELTQKSGTWATVNRDIFALIGIIVILSAIVGTIAVKKKQQEA
jgi:ABC-2 type transport system permease protein